MKPCFAILPFSSSTQEHTERYWKAFLKDFLRPALHQFGYDPQPYEDRPVNLAKELVQKLATSELVIAVLTDGNPNVFYELGIRHCSRSGTVMIIDDKQEIPFYFKNYGVIKYDESNPEAFRARLQHYLATGSERQHDSPVGDFLEFGAANAMNMARGVLAETVRVVEEQSRNHAPREEILQKIMEYQKSLLPRAQVSVVERGKIISHEDSTVMTGDPLRCWLNVMEPRKSFLPHMLASRNGLKWGVVEGRDNRLTAIAYATLVSPEWLIVAEGHYHQGSRDV